MHASLRACLRPPTHPRMSWLLPIVFSKAPKNVQKGNADVPHLWWRGSLFLPQESGLLNVGRWLRWGPSSSLALNIGEPGWAGDKCFSIKLLRYSTVLGKFILLIPPGVFLRAHIQILSIDFVASQTVAVACMLLSWPPEDRSDVWHVIRIWKWQKQTE